MAEAPIAYTLMRIANMLEEILKRLPPPRPKPVGYQNENQCVHCGTMFIAGAGTGRRLNAVFCCDEHRVRHNSLKRSPQARRKPPKTAENPELRHNGETKG
jgi:hypothetical protein